MPDLQQLVIIGAHTQCCFSDAPQRNHRRDGATGDGFLRHAEHHAAELILGNGLGSALAHLEQALRAVIAHAGHQDSHCVAGRGLGDRAKQHVNTGPVPRHQGTRLHL